VICGGRRTPQCRERKKKGGRARGGPRNPKQNALRRNHAPPQEQALSSDRDQKTGKLHRKREPDRLRPTGGARRGPLLTKTLRERAKGDGKVRGKKVKNIRGKKKPAPNKPGAHREEVLRRKERIIEEKRVVRPSKTPPQKKEKEGGLARRPKACWGRRLPQRGPKMEKKSNRLTSTKEHSQKEGRNLQLNYGDREELESARGGPKEGQGHPSIKRKRCPLTLYRGKKRPRSPRGGSKKKKGKDTRCASIRGQKPLSTPGRSNLRKNKKKKEKRDILRGKKRGGPKRGKGPCRPSGPMNDRSLVTSGGPPGKKDKKPEGLEKKKEKKQKAPRLPVLFKKKKKRCRRRGNSPASVHGPGLRRL